MTLNGHFALKSVSGSATNGLASPAFGKFAAYPHTVSDKNVAQGSLWPYMQIMQIFAGVPWGWATNECGR